MSDTTNEVLRIGGAGDVVFLPLASTAAVYKRGWLMNRNASGYGKVGADATAEEFAGMAEEAVTVITGGSNGAEKMHIARKGVRRFTFASTLTQAALGKAAYVKDNYRLALFADVTHAVFAGIIVEVISSGEAFVDIEPATLRYALVADAIS